MKRALVLANVFNLLIGIYFIIISIVSLVHLRWYHQLTITIKVRHLITSVTSYSSFVILLIESIILITIFILSGSFLSASKKHIRPNQESINLTTLTTTTTNDNNMNINININEQQTNAKTHYNLTENKQQYQTLAKQRIDDKKYINNNKQIVFNKQTSLSEPKYSHICCSIFIHLISSICLIIILIIWLLNTGELVRDSISSQLDSAFLHYQFANRSNHYSVAIDGMQDINNCCGSLDYTDFPHQRISGLSSGHYPGSCCGKHIFGVNARVLCVPEEIVRAKQTAGCVTVLSNFYDLISILVVPAALICLFVNITIIALTTISRGYNLSITEFPIIDRSPTNTRYSAGY